MRDGVYHQISRVLEHHWWTRARRRQVAQFLRRVHVKPDGSHPVLEIGCGTGTEHAFLSRFGPVTGVEISKIGFSYCRSRGYAALFRDDLNEFKPAEKAFDLAVCFNVLYHEWILDPVLVLRRVRRGLRAGGRLVIAEPAFEFLRRAHDEVDMGARRWGPRAFRTLLGQAGFTIESMTGFTALLSPVVAARALWERIRGVPETDEIDELRPPPAWAARPLDGVMTLEAGFSRWISFPFGTTWLAVARRPAEPGALPQSE